MLRGRSDRHRGSDDGNVGNDENGGTGKHDGSPVR